MSESEARVATLKGNVATMLTSSSFPYEIITKAPELMPKFNAVAFPMNKTRGTYYWSGHHFVFKYAAHAKWAKSFLKFWHQPREHLRYIAECPTGFIPVQKSVIKDPAFLEHPNMKPIRRIIEAASDSLPYASTPGTEFVMNPYGGEIESRLLLKKIAELTLVEGKPPAEAIATGERWIKDMIKEMG